jgi:DnaJ-domain-containing protein 1
VTHAEALAVLGLALPTDADTARRTYARLLKKHKPEVDPEGFMRLREAYERVRDALAASAPLPPAPGPASAPLPAPDPTPAFSPEPPRAPPAPAPIIPAAPRPPFDAEDEADVEALVELGGLAEAAELVGAALFLAQRRGVFDGLPVDLTLALILRLHARGLPAAGWRLEQSLTAWLDAGEAGARLIRDGRALRLELARELGALPFDLPRQVRSALASAALAGDLARADEPLLRAYQRSAKQARRLADLLDRSAPLYAEALSSTLRRPRPARWNVGCLLAPPIAVVISAVIVLWGDSSRAEREAALRAADAFDAAAEKLDAPDAREVRRGIEARRCAETRFAMKNLQFRLRFRESARPADEALARAELALDASLDAWCVHR